MLELLIQELKTMDVAILCAIISTVGTIFGTILGWVLNSLSQRGKLNFFIYNWGESFEMRDGYGGFKPSASKGASDRYTCHLDLDIYNSGINSKIMRSLQLRFYSNEKELLSLYAYDNSTKRLSGGVIRNDEIEAINIPGKNVSNIHISSGMGSNAEMFDLLYQSNKVYLTYRDEKNKLVKLFVSNHNCDDFFSYMEKNNKDE